MERFAIKKMGSLIGQGIEYDVEGRGGGRGEGKETERPAADTQQK